VTHSPLARAILVVLAVLGTVALILAALYVVVLIGAFAFATPA
jgi:hypothetical protein